LFGLVWFGCYIVVWFVGLGWFGFGHWFFLVSGSVARFQSEEGKKKTPREQRKNKTQKLKNA
jgi:hypothetical protein